MIDKELQNKINEFEGFIEKALDYKYSSLFPPEVKDHFLKTNPILKWNINEFVASYMKHNIYPPDRINDLIHLIFDIKLEFYYIIEIDIGLYNRLVYDKGYDKKNPKEIPHVLLTRFSLDQSLIGKSRILWERIMNFIYYLETGELLDAKVSGRKSKRKIFFKFTEEFLHWNFLTPYEEELQAYEDNFRTPEFHKNSVLRAELFGNRFNDPNDLLNLVNRALNVIWENTGAIISGKKPYLFTDLHHFPSG